MQTIHYVGSFFNKHNDVQELSSIFERTGVWAILNDSQQCILDALQQAETIHFDDEYSAAFFIASMIRGIFRNTIYCFQPNQYSLLKKIDVFPLYVELLIVHMDIINYMPLRCSELSYHHKYKLLSPWWGINSVDKHGFTLMNYSVFHMHDSSITYLQKKGANMHVQDSRYNNYQAILCKHDHYNNKQTFRTLQIVFQHDADLVKEEYFYYQLINNISYNHVPSVQELLISYIGQSQQKNINFSRIYTTVNRPLLCCVESVEMLTLLESYGLQITTEMIEECSPFITNLEFLKRLIARGWNPNSIIKKCTTNVTVELKQSCNMKLFYNEPRKLFCQQFFSGILQPYCGNFLPNDILKEVSKFVSFC